MLGGKRFLLTFPMGKGPGKSSSDKIINEDEQQVTPGKQTVRNSYPKKTCCNSGFLLALHHPFDSCVKKPYGVYGIIIIHEN